MDNAVPVDEAVYRALLRLAVAAGTLGNALQPDPVCQCDLCELARAWHTFASDPAVEEFVDRKLAVEAAARLLRLV